MFSTYWASDSFVSNSVFSTLTLTRKETAAATDQLGLTFIMNISYVGLEALGGGKGFLTEMAGNNNIGMLRQLVFS